MKLQNVWYIGKCDICDADTAWKNPKPYKTLCDGCWEIGHRINCLSSIKVARYFLKELKIRIKEIKTGYLNE